MGGLNIQYPNVSEGSAENQIKQIKDYLFQLTDQLNLQDNSAEKMFEEVSKAIDAEAVADGSNEQLSKLKEYANLKALIIKTGDYATSHSEEFKKILRSEFSAISEFGEFSEELVQQVTENSSGIERLFDYTAGINNADADWAVGTQQFIKTGLLYYDEGQVPVFGVGVGVISTIVAQDNTVVDMEANQLATFTADEIAFWDNGNKVAYIKDNAINFPAANIRGGSIHIGEEENNFFKVDTSGNLSVGNYFSVDSSGLAKFQSADKSIEINLESNYLSCENDGMYTKLKADGIYFELGNDTVGRIAPSRSEAGDVIVLLNESFAQLNNFLVLKDTDTSVNVAELNSNDYGGQLLLNGPTGNKIAELATTQYGTRLYFDDITGKAALNAGTDSNGNNVISLYADGNRDIVLSAGEYNSYVELKHLGVPSANLTTTPYGGAFYLNDEEGNRISSFNATSSGSVLSLGNADDGLWTVAEYDNEGRHVHADHFHFHNKTDGLITGTVAVSECSAYVVIGQPTAGGFYSTAVIPSELATSRTWQIADEVNYITFEISSDGTITTHGGSAGRGSLTDAYSIR